MTLGERVQGVRLAMGLSRNEFARYLGVSLPSTRRMELMLHVPSQRVLDDIQRASLKTDKPIGDRELADLLLAARRA